MNKREAQIYLAENEWLSLPNARDCFFGLVERFQEEPEPWSEKVLFIFEKEHIFRSYLDPVLESFSPLKQRQLTHVEIWGEYQFRSDPTGMPDNWIPPTLEKIKQMGLLKAYREESKYYKPQEHSTEKTENVERKNRLKELGFSDEQIDECLKAPPGIGGDKELFHRDLVLMAVKRHEEAVQQIMDYKPEIPTEHTSATVDYCKRKLSQKAEIDLVREYNRGYGTSETALAGKYGVSRTTVNNILIRHGIKAGKKKSKST